jgi:hypothetical protein
LRSTIQGTDAETIGQNAEKTAAKEP